MTPANPPLSAPPRRKWLLALPFLFFAALAAVFLVRLVSGEDSEFIPSVLIGQPAPVGELPPLEPGLPGLKAADLAGQVTVINIFASWCGPCRLEHPQLQALAHDKRARLVGINYKDVAGNARRFLGEFGNPYAAIGVDANGRAAIDWGVSGVPETFIVGKDGVVRYKYTGPISPEALEKLILPEIAKAASG